MKASTHSAWNYKIQTYWKSAGYQNNVVTITLQSRWYSLRRVLIFLTCWVDSGLSMPKLFPSSLLPTEKMRLLSAHPLNGRLFVRIWRCSLCLVSGGSDFYQPKINSKKRWDGPQKSKYSIYSIRWGHNQKFHTFLSRGKNLRGSCNGFSKRDIR